MDSGPNDQCFWQGELDRFLPDPTGALEEALGYVGCPICHVLAAIPLHYFAALPMRWPKEQDLRTIVCRAGGFCNRHTWKFFDVQSLAAVARVFIDVLTERPRVFALGTPCPACQVQRLAEQVLVDHFLAWLERPESQKAYPVLPGVCYRHHELLLQREPPESVRDALVRGEEAQREELGRDLRGFLDKNSVEAKWTRTDAERQAPRRALLKTAGNDEAWV